MIMLSIMILGCRQRNPSQVHNKAVVIPEYLYHGIISLDINHTCNNAIKVAVHLTQKSKGLLIMPILDNIPWLVFPRLHRRH